ncbi:hypothetical protein VTN49DRAFT_7634 [Thermomyces lanuginosus]|uniref:uncharacterized protein n=1 Tax=Thermomyces lanuginosus TaxID=5541 RepID=UPI0037444900
MYTRLWRLNARPKAFRQLSRSSYLRFSTSLKPKSYDDTLSNLRIGAHTRVIYQGFTGRQATANAEESIAWGTKIVGGVKPDVYGEHLGLPIFPSVREAKAALKPDASAIYVPGNHTAKAIEEALEAEIPLIVAVAEHVPIHDMLRIHSMLKTQSKSRLVGANCPGIISPVGRCRIGFQPLPCYAPGRIGLVAKSGTLSYEAVASLTRAGLGQSLCISMGGDVLAGTTFVDGLKLFENDPDTDAIILIGEVGGVAELDAAEWIKDYRKRSRDPKPIMALIGGLEAPQGRIMGHAGAWAGPEEPDAKTKYRALEDAGVVMVDHPEKFGERMKTLLAGRGRPSAPGASPTPGTQKKGYHTLTGLRRHRLTRRVGQLQRRNLYLTREQGLEMLKEHAIRVGEEPSGPEFTLYLSIDRTLACPCFIVYPSNKSAPYKIPFSYENPEFHRDNTIPKKIASFLQLPEASSQSIWDLIRQLWGIFKSKEAFLLEVRASLSPKGVVVVHDTRFGFDDAAFHSAGRQKDVHALRDPKREVPEEAWATKQGIIYVKLEGEGSIGTLVNGAGLAMNTVDALIKRGGHPANFLDTGGKATAITVKECFKILCSDPRVKTIFVNIFGGLTKCDMIADGIIMAFKELDMKVPVVVRLRGTNEAQGQKKIADSGLALHAFDSFEEAAQKAIELAGNFPKSHATPITF